MYVDIVPNRNSRPAILLREGWREGKRIRKRTIANLTEWPKAKVEALRRLLRDEPLMAPSDVFVVQRTLPHGHVEAVLGTIHQLELDRLIASKRCRERDLVIAMIAEQLIHPSSKLGTTRLWHTTTLAQELGVVDADEDDLYAAMDWLIQRQSRIEKKLASRHLSEGAQVLYDVSSSYYEGRTCPLALFGYGRDGKKGKPILWSVNPNRSSKHENAKQPHWAQAKARAGHPLAATIGDSARCMQNLEKVLFTGPKTSDTVTFICD